MGFKVPPRCIFTKAQDNSATTGFNITSEQLDNRIKEDFKGRTIILLLRTDSQVNKHI